MNAKAGRVFGGQGASWGLVSPHSAPQMPPNPMSETRPRPINSSISLSDVCCLFKFKVVVSPLEPCGWGRVAAAQATHHPLSTFPFLCPHPSPSQTRTAVASQKTGSMLTFAQDSCLGPSSFPSKKYLLGGGGPFLHPKYMSLPGSCRDDLGALGPTWPSRAQYSPEK